MTAMTNAGAGAPAAVPAPVPASVLADAGAAVAAFLRLADDAGPDDAGQDGGGQDAALVQRLAAVAIGMAEAFLGQLLVLRAVEDVVVADGGWRRLAAEPVRTIAGMTALPAGAAPFVLPVADYRIDIAADGRGWVRAGAGASLVAVDYAAGMAADWATLPAPIAQGVVMLAASLFADRDAATALPPGVAALWRPFRRLHLAGDRPGGSR